mgnify:CR=1 FL=1
MGITVSRSINNALNKIIDELEKTGANATKNCEVSIGDIILIDNNKCTVTKQNRCSDNSEEAINAIARAATNAWKEASPTQKMFLIPGVNINDSSENIQELIKRMLREKCLENSAITQSLSQSDLIFRGCQNISIPNINAGTARANCAIRTIIKIIIEADIKEKNMQLPQRNPFNTLFGGIGIICGLLLCVLCCIFILLLPINLIA